MGIDRPENDLLGILAELRKLPKETEWAGLDSDLPDTGKRYPRNDNSRFPLPSKNLAQGDLVLRVWDEQGNPTQHLI